MRTHYYLRGREVKFVLFAVDRLLERGSASRVESELSAWRAWMDELDIHGVLESGLSFEPAGAQVGASRGDVRVLTKDVNGVFIVNASSLGEALRIARSAPHMERGGTMYVRPCAAV